MQFTIGWNLTVPGMHLNCVGSIIFPVTQRYMWWISWYMHHASPSQLIFPACTSCVASVIFPVLQHLMRCIQQWNHVTEKTMGACDFGCQARNWNRVRCSWAKMDVLMFCSKKDTSDWHIDFKFRSAQPETTIKGWVEFDYLEDQSVIISANQGVRHGIMLKS